MKEWAHVEFVSTYSNNICIKWYQNILAAIKLIKYGVLCFFVCLFLKKEARPWDQLKEK